MDNKANKTTKQHRTGLEQKKDPVERYICGLPGWIGTFYGDKDTALCVESQCGLYKGCRDDFHGTTSSFHGSDSKTYLRKCLSGLQQYVNPSCIYA
jgi:hypothetical protein